MLLKTRVPFRCFCSKLALARLQLGGCNRLAVLEKPRRSVPLEGRRPLQKGRGGQARSSNNAISRQSLAPNCGCYASTRIGQNVPPVIPSCLYGAGGFFPTVP